jgi:predicted O-methyltransferase YrrM
MYSKIQLAFKYLSYYLSASNGKGHGMHSPFVFDFIISVLNDTTRYSDYFEVEKLRKKLLENHRILKSEVFGAGSSVNPKTNRTVSDIAANSAKPKKYGQLLYRMVKKYQPETILELGTSLGITSSYLAKGNPGAKMITLEGAFELVVAANQVFKELELSNIELWNGDFDEKLPEVLHTLTTIDFVFVDGNHRKEPTLNYFNQLLPKTRAETILVFDDIHWSREMEEAWQVIKSHSSVKCAIDLFFIGIIFFREEFKEKQDFIIRF